MVGQAAHPASRPRATPPVTAPASALAELRRPPDRDANRAAPAALRRTPAPGGPPALPACDAEPPAPKSGFWVYRRAKAGRYEPPLFPEPLLEKSHVDADAASGQDWCYVVRAVASHEPLIESGSSNEVCLTARDIAPPTVPAGLTLLAEPGALELRWSPSPEADLALYRVYRAGPTGAAEKIAEVPAGTTVFLDTTATPRDRLPLHDHRRRPGGQRERALGAPPRQPPLRRTIIEAATTRS